MCDIMEKYIKEEKENTLFSLVQRGGLSVEVAAEELNLSIDDFELEMIKAGYKIPEKV